MATVIVKCIHCSKVYKRGKAFQAGKQRYRCQATTCKRSFILNYSNKGWQSNIKRQIVDCILTDTTFGKMYENAIL